MTVNEALVLKLTCIVFVISLFYGLIFLLCFMMYPKQQKEAIDDEEAGEPLPAAVRLEKCGEGDMCVICLEDLEENDVVRVLVGCNHVFHVDCIDSWCFYKLTCPVCRKPFQWFGDWFDKFRV